MPLLLSRLGLDLKMVQLVSANGAVLTTSTSPGFWFSLATYAGDEAEPPVARDSATKGA